MSRLRVLPENQRRGHAGLRAGKFLELPQRDRGDEWFKLIQQLDYPAYRMAYQRWEKHWNEKAPEGRLCIKGRVRARLAVGLGAKGVLEAGLSLSHTYGVPVIPASAVKGVLRAASKDDKKLMEFLFGNEDAQGFAEFQDAWWVPDAKSPLAMDVITAHHPDYYGGKNDASPSDCDSPTPLPFVSVRGTFLFVAEGPDAAWRDYLEKLLKRTLEISGIGGKTAAGYGRFVFGG